MEWTRIDAFFLDCLSAFSELLKCTQPKLQIYVGMMASSLSLWKQHPGVISVKSWFHSHQTGSCCYWNRCTPPWIFWIKVSKIRTRFDERNWRLTASGIPCCVHMYHQQIVRTVILEGIIWFSKILLFIHIKNWPGSLDFDDLASYH